MISRTTQVMLFRPTLENHRGIVQNCKTASIIFTSLQRTTQLRIHTTNKTNTTQPTVPTELFITQYTQKDIHIQYAINTSITNSNLQKFKYNVPTILKKEHLKSTKTGLASLSSTSTMPNRRHVSYGKTFLILVKISKEENTHFLSTQQKRLYQLSITMDWQLNPKQLSSQHMLNHNTYTVLKQWH